MTILKKKLVILSAMVQNGLLKKSWKKGENQDKQSVNCFQIFAATSENNEQWNNKQNFYACYVTALF